MGEPAVLPAQPAVSLCLRGLRIEHRGRVLVDGVSLELAAGRVVALVGASGSGKTLTARSLVGMVNLEPGVVSGDLSVSIGSTTHVPYQTSLAQRDFDAIRRVVGYVPQNATAALDPSWTVRASLRESAPVGDDALCAAMSRAGFSTPRPVLDLFPHELSGGMAQRVVIAQALLAGNNILVCDEPTTALDAPIQAEIVAELARLVAGGLGVLMITHDLRLLPGFADEVIFLDQGRVVEATDAGALVDGRLKSAPARRLVDATRRIAGGRLG